ncbi:PD-(D/E)XK nuclease family protein [Halorubrum coriense]|nr:PD-(D/E)XK nuclease family protein [Halorubrum coriense]
MSETTLETHLQDIEERLAGVDRPPTTTLDILGEAKRERYWEDLLVYFLDSSNPHGFGSDVLQAFLNAITAHDSTSLSSTRSDLGQIEVHSQVPTEDGVFDILLWCEDAWYVVIELKVDAAETGVQTRRYAQATELGDLDVSQHDGVSEYVYLAPGNARSSKSETFVDISWESVVPYFEDVLRTSHGQYPSKSYAQFADYLDTIQQTLNMDDFTTISDETKLYTEYADTIDRLVQAYEDDKNKVFNRLETAFFGELDGDHEEWTVNNRPNTYINFAKKDWGNVAGSVTIEYELHVHLNRDHPDIRLRLDIERGDKQQIRQQLHTKLNENELDRLENNGWEIVDSSYAYFAKSVPLDTEQPDDSIRNAIQTLHSFRQIVEPSLTDIVADHQTQ